ncbi:MAG: hypothetical protein U0401_13620 [Anaerolineae bacterium]
MAPKISPVLERQMNALPNQEPIPVIVRRKEGFFAQRQRRRLAVRLPAICLPSPFFPAKP